MVNWFSDMAANNNFWPIFTFVLRPVTLVLCVLIFLRCVFPLVKINNKSYTIARFKIDRDLYVPINQWESVIGRSKLSDILIPSATVSRKHFILTVRNNSFYICPASKVAKVWVNERRIYENTEVNFGDKISIGNAILEIVPALEQRADETEKEIAPKYSIFNNATTLFLIVVLQFLTALHLTLVAQKGFSVFMCFLALIGTEVLYYNIRKRYTRKFELELLVFLLVGIGFSTTASISPGSLFKQYIAFLLGLILFTVGSFFIKNIDLAMKARYIIGALGVALLILNLFVGTWTNGQKNWIDLGFITIQPSEFVKIAFIFAGAATLERIYSTRNLILFMAFTAAIILPLIKMHDFGTTAIFFVTFLVIVFMRSGDIRAIGLIISAAALGAILVIAFTPYILDRFESWRHIWEPQYIDANGWQQTRTLIASGSGGLLGLGAGMGNMKDVIAADTDLVFGAITEEFGLIVAICVALSYLCILIYAIKSCKNARSAYYGIAAVAAAALLLFQAGLNIFGSLDIIPLTGVTLPFISNGGSSMIACFGLLIFLKAIDRREFDDKEVIRALRLQSFNKKINVNTEY